MKFTVHKHNVLYQGFFRMEKFHVSYELFNGKGSATVTREVLERGNAAAVLPYDPVADKVVLIEQFRVGAMEDKNGPWLIETIAGMMDANESADEVVRREADEEAKCALGQLIPIAEYYCSPGGCTEKVHLFCGQTDTKQLVNLSVHGLATENEDIRLHICSYEQMLDYYASGKCNNAMTLIAVQWLILHRDKVRSMWLD